MAGLFSLEGKVAVITGGSRGIGKSIAIAYGNAGAKGVVAARKIDLVGTEAEEIRGQGGEGIAVECDLLKDADLFNLVTQTVNQYGRLDILVNNAGISPFVKKSEEVTKEEWEQVIRVNLTAAFILSCEAGKIMIKNNLGEDHQYFFCWRVSWLPKTNCLLRYERWPCSDDKSISN